MAICDATIGRSIKTDYATAINTTQNEQTRIANLSSISCINCSTTTRSLLIKNRQTAMRTVRELLDMKNTETEWGEVVILETLRYIGAGQQSKQAARIRAIKREIVERQVFIAKVIIIRKAAQEEQEKREAVSKRVIRKTRGSKATTYRRRFTIEQRKEMKAQRENHDKENNEVAEGKEQKKTTKTSMSGGREVGKKGEAKKYAQ